MKLSSPDRKESRVIRSIKRFLLLGLSPGMISRTVGAGFCIGVIPLPGTSTLLCTIVSITFRMNLALIQLVNYAVLPVQLLLFIPFYKTAAWLTNSVILDDFPNKLLEAFKADWWETLNSSFLMILAAVLVWLIISLPLFLIVTKASLFVVKRFEARSGGKGPSSDPDE